MGTFKTSKLLYGNPALIPHISNAIEQEFKKDEFEDETVSSSGINYGETVNKSSLKNILITVGVAAVAAGVVVLLMSPSKKNMNQNNLAEIPTISPSEPIKIIPEDAKLNEVFESASVYNPTNFDDEAKNREAWNLGRTIDPTSCDLIEALRGLL